MCRAKDAPAPRLSVTRRATIGAEPPSNLSMSTNTTTHINTEGGSFVGDSVDNRDGIFIGRDVNLNLTLRYTAGEMQELLDQLLTLLRLPDARIGDGAVVAQERALSVGPAQFEALSKYLAAVPAAGAVERETRYLARLCIHPDFQQWQTRYVTLSGAAPPPELTPRYSEILFSGVGPQRESKRVPIPDIRDAVQRYSAFILKGLPGGGKTTVLQRLALDQALARLHDPDAAWLPLWVRLAAQKSDETPDEFLARMWRLENPGGDSHAELIQALHGGRLCILCDGLNEASRERFRERTDEWRVFAETLPAGNRLIFSCRSQDYGGELAVQQVEIDPLSDEQIEDFSRRYLGDTAGMAFWNALQGEHGTLLPLARTPFYLKMMVEEFAAGGQLPAVRARLLTGFTEKLFGRELRRNHPDWIEPAAQHLALSQLAFAMQAIGEGTQVDRAWALDVLPEQVAMPDGADVATPPAAILRLAHAATLLGDAAAGDSRERQIRFSHHLLQEYFAAGEMLWRLRLGEGLAGLWRAPSRVDEMPVAERGQWEPLPGPPTNGWEQTTILAAGLDPTLIAAVQAVNPALAARCALESGLDWQNGEVDAAQVASCRQALLDRLGDVRIHLRSRIEAGLLLGRLKDPRFPLETVGGVRVILPPLVEIAAAEARIGSSRLDLGQAFADEFMRHKVPLAAYAIGRYPVTNAEYACFLAAGGYEENRWWTAGGRFWLRGEPVPGEEDPVDWWMKTWRRWKENPAEIAERQKAGLLTARDAYIWRGRLDWTEQYARDVFQKWYPQKKHVEPEYWQEQDLNNPSQPVVGVCWYEAMAYARWLAAVTSLSFRLPSEPEWEWAARRGGRVFPWGRRWKEERLNSLEGSVMRTTPVGAYPHGATPDGIHDLSGNVWEWTATRYADYPYRPEANLEDPDATGIRVTRGGGFANHRRMLRCAFRDGYDPWDGDDGLGYRIARSLE